jgi:hypothetical protein
MTTPTNSPDIPSLKGLWYRSLIRWPDGRTDTTTRVSWLQGPGFYIDLRQPEGRPDFANVRSISDLDDGQIDWLVMQEGFAGRLCFDGSYFEWGRDIDLQPKGVYSDCGRLWYDGDHVVEEGRDIPYIEHWHHRLDGDPAVCGAIRLQSEDGRAGFIVRVGDMFMYARGRRITMPDLPDLRSCVRAAATREELFDLLDCEIAFGHVAEGCWRIVHSSQPFREGCDLGPALRATDALTTTETSPDGRSMVRQWRIIERERDVPGMASAKMAASAQ